MLLIVAQLLVMLAFYSSQIKEDENGSLVLAVAIDGANFTRSKAEVLVDRKIGAELLFAKVPIDSGRIKNSIDSAVISSLKETGINKIGLCSKNFAGRNILRQTSGFGDATKVIAIQNHGAAVVEYSVTGTLLGEFPCAKIPVQNVTAWFELPIGYISRSVVGLA